MVLFIVVCVILGFQLIYWFLWLLAFSRDRRKVNIGLPSEPVSVVVCAHDEEANLRELLPLLLAQDHSQFEVIIVEDRSNDASFDYLLEQTQKDTRLRMVRVVQTPEHINAKKFAITLGIKAAQYDWILLTDADCRPVSKSWIRSMSAFMDTDKQFVVGFSPYQRTRGLLNAFIRFETIITAIQFLGFALLGKPYMGVGRNLAYRKSLFLNSKGFNNYLGVMGGDDDLFVNEHAHRKNVAIALGEPTLVMSKPKTSWNSYYYQKIRHLSVGKRYKLSDRIMLGLFTMSWILTWAVAIPIAFSNPYGSWIVFIFFVRLALQATVFQLATSKLGTPFEGWKLPLLDFIYAFYYLVVGPIAAVTKKVRWKS